ncbi:MAG: glycoside hydrolase family 38 C-terminal domain-containing protein [Eubacteriales bacterium]|nr:glycoside hydrolase family 38 C-terminal domain-containing protein [Eubacteriales bacterium]
MKKMHLVSHVHWDPAWYLPYEQYRITLIPLMKKLLNILEDNKEYKSFMFDGQVDAIDDYLLLFPEDRPRIERLVKSGKLIVGPWYIQPEEFLLSGETHIRNMLIGMKKANGYGGAHMPVTYLCDMVGHIAQMPQLVKGFNMNYFVGWRGILDGEERDAAGYIWEAPDGSQILMKDLTNGYYNFIPGDFESFEAKIDEIYKILEPYEKGEHILIMQGADHRPPIENTPELIKQYNEKKGSDLLEQVTLLEHFESINIDDCKPIKGELRKAWFPHSFMLTGILTARMSIKYKNEYVSRELERWAEPFASVNSWINGAEYPYNLLSYAWVKQLKCAFHDCIYGAHVDSVTEDIFNDYKKILEITDWTNGESLYALTKSIHTVGDGDNITVFNPTQWERTNYTVDFDYLVIEDKEGYEFAVFTDNGEYLPVQVTALEKGYKGYTGFSANQWEQCDPTLYNKYTLSVNVPIIPGFGYINLGIKRIPIIDQKAEEYIKVRKLTMDKTDIRLSGNVCENSYLKVAFEDNGYISVYDKTTHSYYENINRIEESGDKGDLYNYSSPYSDKTYYDSGAKTVTYIQDKGPNKVVFVTERKWMLPREVNDINYRSDDLVVNTLKTYVTISSYSKLIEIKTVIDNQSKDHRYRLFIPTGIEGREIQSGSQFYINNRKRIIDIPDSYIEQPMNNQPQRLFTDVSDGKRGITIISRGFSEYDARDNGDVYFTMLRCVSHLSKDTNGERSYCNAGPGYATPLAQEIGIHEIEYALYFHQGDYIVGESVKACDEFYARPRCVQGNKYDGNLPASGSYITLNGEGIVLSAVKKAENGNDWIIRVYNSLDKSADATISTINKIVKATKTNLNEDYESDLVIKDNIATFNVGAYEIYTICLTFEEE